MKHLRTSVAVLTIALGIGIAIFQSASAQIKPIRPNLEIAGADYHLVHTASYMYRYDSKTGTTQRLDVTSKNGTGENIKYNWLPLLDQQAGPAGAAGKYEVVEGTASTGMLVRSDVTSGRTWVLVQTSTVNWQEVTSK